MTTIIDAIKMCEDKIKINLIHLSIIITVQMIIQIQLTENWKDKLNFLSMILSADR